MLNKNNEEDRISKSSKEALFFFLKHTASIEIKRDGIIFRQYFPLLPYTFCVTNEIKKFVLESVNRMSAKSKVTSLLFLSEDAIDMLKYEDKFPFIKTEFPDSLQKA